MIGEIPRMAVIPTHNRPAELQRCVKAIAPQVSGIIVIDNASDPPVRVGDLYAAVELAPHAYDHLGWDPPMIRVFRDEEQPPNLSRLWNLGLDDVARACRNVGIEAWDVAVLNDDAVPPPGWFDAVSTAMRDHDGEMDCPPVAACSAPFDDLAPGQVRHWGAGATPSVFSRLAGWAHILRGEWEGARYDEKLRWWFADDDLSLRARLAGGLVHVGGFPVPNTGADSSTTGLLAEQAGRDRATFVAKHGCQPW